MCPPKRLPDGSIANPIDGDAGPGIPRPRSRRFSDRGPAAVGPEIVVVDASRPIEEVQADMRIAAQRVLDKIAYETFDYGEEI